MLEAKLQPVLRPLFKLLRVNNLEDFLKRLVRLVFGVVLLVPLILLPIYFFIFTVLRA